MSNLAKQAAKVLLTVMLGGFLAATLVRMAPGFGVDEEELDTRLSRQSRDALRQENSAGSNLASFYVHYLGGLVRGDLGKSTTLEQPVAELLAQRFPETLKSVAAGLALGWALGLPLAILAVMSRSWYVDLGASLVSGILLCTPAAVLALLFVIMQAPGRLVIGLIVFPKVFRYARNLLAQNFAAPHVLTARAKGLSEMRVLIWHVLPVAAPSLLALAGISLSIAFATAIPVEVLCDLPGIGQLAWKAALGRDLALLVNLTLIVTVITVLGNSASEVLGNSFRRAEA